MMDEARKTRIKLIEDLEEWRKSKLIVYFTGDRQPFGSRIAEDAVRPLYDHLANLDFGTRKKKVVDLFVYSRGGDVSVPWRIASMIREFCDEFNILVPYKAQSAATLLSLGADQIVMGKKAELGPIDPTLVKATVGEGILPPQEISVEDVNSFLSFIKERANINDQAALAQVVRTLVTQISPLALGSVNRQNSHIRLVARKLLTSRREKMDEEKINGVIETLTEKIYSHGHGIGRKEARDIGLPIVTPSPEMEDLIWELYLKYEDFLDLLDPIHPEVELADSEEKTLPSLPLALIESAEKLHIHKVNVHLMKTRKVPSSPQISVNLNLQLPPNIQPAQIPQQAQQILQELMGQISQNVAQLVHQEIVRQSPIIGIGGRAYGGKWYEER
jgi:hypothetical protein